MARKRLLSPEFFTHSALYDAEAATGLPLRLAFAGLWTVTDRRGLFSWKPRELKLSILPYDSVDFETVLLALHNRGFVQRYIVDGKAFGCIPSFGRWQTFHKHEKPSDAPEPTEPSYGCVESDIGGPESSSVEGMAESSTPITGTGTGTVAVAVPGSGTNAAAGAVGESPVSGGDTNVRAHNSDPVELLLAEFEFGAFAPSVAGLCRSARHFAAVIATLRMHAIGELGHELATPLELGLACQQYLANGEPFNPLFFAGFVKKAKAGAARAETRKRNAAEDRRIAYENDNRDRAAADERAGDEILERFAADEPDRYAELHRVADKNVPAHITLGRDVIVRAQLLTLIRREVAAVA